MIRWPKLVFCQNSQQDFSSLCVCVCTTGVCAGPYNKNRTFWLAPFSLFYTDWCEKERVVPQPNQQRRHMWVKQGGARTQFRVVSCWQASAQRARLSSRKPDYYHHLFSFLVCLTCLSTHTLSLCVCVCVDTRRGAGSGLAKQKIRKKKSRRKRPIPVYTGHNQCRSHLQHERLLAFRSSFFRQFLSFHYYYLLFDHRRRPFIFEKKTSDEMKIWDEPTKFLFCFAVQWTFVEVYQ